MLHLGRPWSCLCPGDDDEDDAGLDKKVRKYARSHSTDGSGRVCVYVCERRYPDAPNNKLSHYLSQMGNT